MTVSSINFQKRVYQNALKHDERKSTKEPSYLLKKEFRKENEFRKYFNVAERFSAVEKIFSKRKGKHPTFENSYLEAVVNLEEHHTIDDVEKLRKVISDTLGFQVSEIAVHRDEGYVSNDGQVKYNYHAHIGCFTLDANGKQLNRQPKAMHFKLQKLQTEVAEVLGMQRGKENSKATRLDHKQYREKAKELERAEQKQKQEIERAKLAVLEQVQPVLQKSVEDKKQLQADVKKLQDEVLTLTKQKAIVEAERKKYKDEGDHIASEYRKLQALNQTLHTQEELDKALADLRQEYEARLALKDEEITELQEKLDTKPKEVIKTVEKIVEKSIQVEVPRQLTTSEIKELAEYQKLQNDYNELANDYRHLQTDYNNLKTEYNLLKRSKTNDDTSECSRVRIDTENQSENILEAYARQIGYNKSEPKQADEFDNTEKTTQTTSFFRSKGFHR